MKKILYFIAALMVTIFWNSCKEEQNLYIDPNAPAPAQVSAIKVVATPGGAIITYKTPLDSNLLYAKAVYEIQTGVFREAKSSYYRDTLELVGYGDTLNHEVKIYSVGKNEKESEPISVSIKPLTPPVQTIFKTMDLSAAFGGVIASFQNDLQANFAIVLITDTTGLGNWVPINTFYTSALQGKFVTRGFKPKEMKFAVFLRDRWNNRSDTLKKLLTPLYEELIDRKLISGVTLPTDAILLAPTNGLANLLNGITNSAGDIYATLQTNTIPQWFTLNLGQKVVLSRFKMFQRANYAYNSAVPEKFEIWGSNNPNPDGSWASWDLLGQFHSFKPSGLGFGKTNADDISYAVFNGEDFDFMVQPPAVKYIRFKTTKTYGDIGQVVLSELTFWGQIVP